MSRRSHGGFPSELADTVSQGISSFFKKKYAVPVTACIGGAAALCIAAGLILSGSGHAVGAASSVPGAESAGSVSYAEIEADSAYDATETVIDVSAYDGTILPAGEDAGSSYIDETLFIGDSNCYRYMNYGFCTLKNDIGVVGMGANAITSLGCVKFKNASDYITIPKAVTILQPKRIIIGFGTNNLGGDTAAFISAYQKGIQAIYAAYPYCDIIVNALPPVDKNRSYTNVTMQMIDKFNEALVKMCEANGWKFLNSSEALKDSTTGFAKLNYTVSDGLHLSKEGCTALFDYIRKHSYETEDLRPKPLKAIPERAETPPDLIVKDPLKSNTAFVDVTFTAGEGGSIEGDTEQTVQGGKTCSAVTAVPNTGYEFAGWSCTQGSADGGATLSFAVPKLEAYGGIFVTANFKAIGYTVNFTLSSLEGGVFVANNSTSCAVGVTHGSTATVVFKPAAGYAPAPGNYNLAAVGDGTYTVYIPSITANTNVTLNVSLLPTPTPTITPTPTPGAAATPTPTPTPTPAPETTPTPAPETTPTPAPETTPTPAPETTPTQTPAASTPASEPTPPASEPTPPASEPAPPASEPASPASEPASPASEPAAPASEPASVSLLTLETDPSVLSSPPADPASPSL